MDKRALTIGLLVAVLLAGCTRGDAARPADDGTPSAAPTRAAEPSGRGIAVGPDLAITVPEGWRVLRDEAPWPDVEPTSVCLVPPGNHLPPCAGVSFAWGPDLGGPRGAGSYRPDQPGGWYDGSDVARCPVDDSVDTMVEPGRDPIIDSGSRAVGDHDAAWNRWRVTCADGSTFEPQAWFLRSDEVLIKDLTGHRETAEILASAAFREDGAAIPAAASHESVWVTGVLGDTFTVRSVPAGAPRNVDVSRAVCTGWLAVPGEILAPEIACSRFAGALRRSAVARVSVLLWLEADGTVAQVSQDFRGPQSAWIPHEADSSSPS